MSAKPAPSAPARRVRATWLDRVVAEVNPAAGRRRLADRIAFARLDAISADLDLANLGQAGDRTARLRDNRTQNAVVSASAEKSRNAARVLERDNDIAQGVIAERIRSVIGPDGLSIEPQVRKRGSGDEHTKFSDDVLRLWRDWIERPEVTGQFSWVQVQQKALAAHDVAGECFVQIIAGTINTLNHGTEVPLSLELIEADACPLAFLGAATKVEQGVQTNDWGQPTGYWLSKLPPPGALGAGLPVATAENLKYVPAANIVHYANRASSRFNQRRGMSMFTAAVNRIDTIGSMEDAELAAWEMFTRFTGVITTEDGGASVPSVLTGGVAPDGYAADFGVTPGTFAQLRPGESVQAFKTEGQRAPIVDFRNAMIKSLASGLGVSYSNVSRDYSGSYSSQRQELVEQYQQTLVVRRDFADQFIRPIWRAFIDTAIASGKLRVPADLDRTTLYHFEAHGPGMPWIDPEKEAQGIKTMVRSGFRTMSQALRSHGIRFNDLLSQRKAENAALDAAGLRFDSDSRYPFNGPTESVQTTPQAPAATAKADALPDDTQ